MKNLFIFLYLLATATLFTACEDEDVLSSYTNHSAPVLKDFLANIDTGTAGVQSLGKVEVESIGGSSIKSFRLQGSGYTNFSISSTGEISTKSDSNIDCITYKNYDLEVIATNKYGDSNKAEALIQVNCLNEPVLEPYKLNLDYQSGQVGTMSFVRTDTASNNPASDIKLIELVDAPAGLSVDNLGNINVDSFLSQPSYEIKVRAINNNNVKGPYVYLTINTGNTGDNTGIGTSDDFPDFIDQYAYTAAYISQGGYYSVYGYMNFVGDHDYIRIYVEADNTQFTVSLENYNNDNYDFGNGGNYIALYDEWGGYYATASNTVTFSNLNSGYYYINVHETSNSYKLNINSSSSTTDSIGDTISSATYLGVLDSYYATYSYATNIDQIGDRDMFEFYVSEAGTYNLYTLYSSFDTYGRLYDSTGFLMLENDDGTTDINFGMNQYLNVGTYYIEVSSLNDSSTGNYELYVQYIGP